MRKPTAHERRTMGMEVSKTQEEAKVDESGRGAEVEGEWEDMEVEEKRPVAAGDGGGNGEEGGAQKGEKGKGKGKKRKPKPKKGDVGREGGAQSKITQYFPPSDKKSE